MRVLKYQLMITPGRQGHTFPIGAKVIHIGEQTGELWMWVMSDDGHNFEPKWFWVLGTGMEHAGPHLTHLGTAQMRDGLVWHVFEEIAERTVPPKF